MKVTESAIIERPPAEVFDIAADPDTQLKWDPDTLKSVKKLSAQPLGPGARYLGDFKGFGTMEYEFSEYEPPRRFAHHTLMRMGEMTHTFTFEPVPEGTKLTQEGSLKPNLLGWFMQPVMSRMLRKRFGTIASELKQYMVTSSGAN